MLKIICEDRAQADRIRARLDRDPDIKSIVFRDWSTGQPRSAIGTEASREVLRELVPMYLRLGTILQDLPRRMR